MVAHDMACSARRICLMAEHICLVIKAYVSRAPNDKIGMAVNDMFGSILCHYACSTRQAHTSPSEISCSASKYIRNQTHSSAIIIIYKIIRLCIRRDNVKVVVRAEILPRDFLQTPGNYYL